MKFLIWSLLLGLPFCYSLRLFQLQHHTRAHKTGPLHLSNKCIPNHAGGDITHQFYKLSRRRDSKLPSSLSDSSPSPPTSPALTLASIPNLLTLARLISIPILAFSFVLRMKNLSVFIYVLSCLTDFLDGYIARKMNTTSAFGAFLDPVADKLMVAMALILLVCQLPVWWFAVPVALTICREIGVSALREWMAERGQRATVKVGILGKVKTAVQMISISILLEACQGASSDFDITEALGLSRPWLLSAGIFLLYISTALSLVSGGLYLKSAWPYLIGDRKQS